ncbi:TonB-dependent receptor, partial [Flavihumibacter sp. CACIAM 22H1]|uniref:TonB-dependent receptor n=1 Tax=Flavihumibacter sp. CACIAM 22H1 TaxID=1812911 RepID=UPI0025C48546
MRLVRRFAGILIGCCLVNSLAAQCILRFSGVVTDSDTRERLAGASILIKDTRQVVESDAEGRFLLEGLCAGSYNILITHIGCQPLESHIHLKDDLVKDFVLPHAHSELDEVVVVGATHRHGTAITDEVKGRQLAATRGSSLGESLRSISGVNVLQTGATIFKPVIHGLHSNRVLILNNGIRQESQQWGSEHAPEVDPYIANRITVIKGASSIRYGSDAIGGVVLVEPRLLPVQPGLYGEINTAFFSNNRQAVLSGIIENNAAKHPAFSWRLQGTLKKGGNAKTPDYWLMNSGIEEYNFSAAAGWKQQHRGLELFYSNFNTKLGIFRGAHIGNVTDLETAIERGEPSEEVKNAPFSYSIDRPYQQVHHHLLKLKAYHTTGTAGKLNWILSGQYNNRMEYDVKRFNTSTDAPQLDLSITTVGSDLVWDHNSWKGFRGTIGISGSYQFNDSYKQRVFIPNYQAWNGAAFLIEKWSQRKWMLEAGIRYDWRSIFNIEKNNNQQFPDQQFSNISGSAGASYQWSKELTTTLNFSTAWRSPQINELYSDGLHHSSARIETGNPDLNPERANSWMLNLTYQPFRWTIDLGFYHKNISNFIYLAPDYPPVLTIRGAFPSFSFEQTNARLRGLDANIGYLITAHWKADIKASILRAWDKSAEDWLIQMPADRYEAGITYEFGNVPRWQDSYVKLSAQQVLRQSRVPAEGNIEKKQPDGTVLLVSDYAPPPPAYLLANLEAGTKFSWGKQPVHLTLTVTNLLNSAYRDYMNAFRYFAWDIGRNIGLRIMIPLGK